MDEFNTILSQYQFSLLNCGSRRQRSKLRKSLMSALEQLSVIEQELNIPRIPP